VPTRLTIHDSLAPLLERLDPPAAEVLTEAINLFPDAYRHGSVDTLNHLLGQLTADQNAGVALDSQRILAAITNTRRAVTDAPAPDPWSAS
jgi:hypothetical protein